MEIERFLSKERSGCVRAAEVNGSVVGGWWHMWRGWHMSDMGRMDGWMDERMSARLGLKLLRLAGGSVRSVRARSLALHVVLP
jgi:hypothetical protein